MNHSDTTNKSYIQRSTTIISIILLLFFTGCSFIKPLGKEKKKQKITYEKKTVEIEQIDSTKTEKTPRVTSDNITKITEIKISQKTNGMMLIVKTDSKLTKNHISFLSSGNKTASITFYKTDFADDVQKHILSSQSAGNIQLFKLEESTQISIELPYPATSHSIIAKDGTTIISIFK